MGLETAYPPTELDYWLTTYGISNLLPYIFNKYRLLEESSNIFDARSNIAAHIGYMIDRYDMDMQDPVPGSEPPVEE